MSNYICPNCQSAVQDTGPWRSGVCQKCHPADIEPTAVVAPEIEPRVVEVSGKKYSIEKECKDCPHVVGDSYQRDCGFPDCCGTEIDLDDFSDVSIHEPEKLVMHPGLTGPEKVFAACHQAPQSIVKDHPCMVCGAFHGGLQCPQTVPQCAPAEQDVSAKP